MIKIYLSYEHVVDHAYINNDHSYMHDFPPVLSYENKLASLEATLVRNSAHSLTYSLTGVKCRATGVAKNLSCQKYVDHSYERLLMIYDQMHNHVIMNAVTPKFG